MAPKQDHRTLVEISQAEFHELLQEKIQLAIRMTFIAALEEEITAYIQAEPYQRIDTRQDHRNGYYTRDLGTSIGQIKDLPIPRTRKNFQTKAFQRYQRRQTELDGAICEMFVKGVSTHQVGQVVEGLAGIKPSPSAVSRVFHTLAGEFETWKKRKLEAHYLYAFADGTYFTVIYDHEGCKMPVLAVVGITTDGTRDILGFTVGEKENQAAWEDLFQDLKNRGATTIDLWITDGNQAMINAVEAQYPHSQRQRCAKHKMENVLSYVPKKQQEAVEPELKAIFYQGSREKADQEVAAFCAKYATIYPSAVACLQRDLEACLTFYAFPKKHWRTIRTTNVIERLFLEVKKRSKKMSAAFRNEDSCLLMFYAVTRSLKFRNISVSN